jgi:hypothetical protein
LDEPLSRLVYVTFFGGIPNPSERKKIVEDFPLWMKILIWLVVGGTVIYAVGAMLYTSFIG